MLHESKSKQEIVAINPLDCRIYTLLKDIAKPMFAFQNDNMEMYTLEKDLKVFGVEVENFPEGIGDAFDKLVNMISGEVDRSYFGISEMTDKGFSYKAVAEEKYDGETENYNCKRYIIEKGEYLTVRLLDWRKKTDSIKYLFSEICQNAKIDKTKPCVEWYKNDDEMLCMVRIDATKE